ncbi:MAG TPA: alpha/beta hydrolase [Pseudolabrys sp.]|nr:alpha/beta hydrolase [Pseudolabrys sp.]
MSINYEIEYDNRGRVREHPEIFARWERETKDYRALAKGAQLGLSYGPAPRNTVDLFPVKNPNGPFAMFIHGGWWRSLDPSMFSQLAAGPNANGITVAVVGYELCPTCSIADIIEQMRMATLYLWRKFYKRIFVYGHSAGGHLAACMLATDWKKIAPDAPADLVPAAYAISGVFDLMPLLHVSQNADLRLDEKSARAVSPLYWPAPMGRTLDAVVGSLESSEFLRQSRAIAEAWGKSAKTRYEQIKGTNHFTVVDPLGSPDSAMTKRVVDLAKQVAAMKL